MKFLRYFFGLAKYLVVLLLAGFFSYNTVYGMKCPFLSPSSLFYLMMHCNGVKLFPLLCMECVSA